MNTNKINTDTITPYENQVLQTELDYLRALTLGSKDSLPLQTKSPIMQAVLHSVEKVAKTNSTVFIQGETGTGKTMIAKTIHQISPFKTGPFIAVHCGAIPETLIESELFGYEKGAFTGADQQKLGKFEIANGGTIFLDEIGTLSHNAQTKLLKVLQDKTIERLSGNTEIHLNLRVIVATNENLKLLTETGKFRKDLYYRLNVFPIEMPPLRSRKIDISFLVGQFLDQLNKSLQKNITQVHPNLLQALMSYDFPGNIRELENLIERAYILEMSPILNLENLPNELQDPPTTLANSSDSFILNHPLQTYRQQEWGKLEKHYFTMLLSHTKGKISEAARIAGITTRQCHNLIKKHNLQKEWFKS